jgi:RNA polymerase sigma factor for flagellar operon FliA
MAREPWDVTADERAMVRRIAHQMITKLPPNVEIDDLIQVGLLGLMDARQRFDPAQGVKYDTFVSPRIRGAMLDELRAADYLSRGTRRHQKRIEAAEVKLSQTLGRPPRAAEMALELGLSVRAYQRLRGQVYSIHVVHLEDMAGFEGSDFLNSFEAAGQSAFAPLRRLEDQERKRALIKAFDLLPERQKYVMTAYYEHDMGLKEIAAVLKITESRVCQIAADAVATLRRKLKAY